MNNDASVLPYLSLHLFLCEDLSSTLPDTVVIHDSLGAPFYMPPGHFVQKSVYSWWIWIVRLTYMEKSTSDFPRGYLCYRSSCSLSNSPNLMPFPARPNDDSHAKGSGSP